MFISVNQLHEDMGIDKTIARFFVDRKVPADNAYWRKRLLYVGIGNGFVFIPVYYDILYRIGISREFLLAENHIQLMEQVMHYAALVEYNELDFAGHLEKIKYLFTDRVKDLTFYNELTAYLDQPVLKPRGNLGMPVPALNRADVFLFILCDLPMSSSQTDLALTHWYALLSTYLLMDDVRDYQKDKQHKEENSIIELGEEVDGFTKAFEQLHQNSKTLSAINPMLAHSFEERIVDLHDMVPIK